MSAAALTVGAAASAQAQAPAPAMTGAGGFAAGPAPVVSTITCRTGCTGLASAGRNGVVRVSGSALAGTASVVFLGRRGPRDDVSAPATPVDDTDVDVTVPATARSGPVRVVGGDGQLSRASKRRLIIGAAKGAPLLQAHVDARTVFLDGHSRPAVSFFVGGDAPAQVRVDLLHDGDPAPVATWTPDAMPAGTVQTIAWDGALAPVAPPEGRYVFKVTPLSSATPRATGTAAAAHPVSAVFQLVGHAFPVDGPHTIGMDPVQRFGAQRNGHTHQGQDVLSPCGTPLVAVHSGVIRYRGFQSAAGNYVVLRSDGDNTDFAYMHLRDTALVARGDRVTTGQLIGYVGDTGDAEGCHLHFEVWPAPGWYTGGSPIDPLPLLQAWDSAQ
jgi:murein DD-endopeptidase MepM/ murein hydrolase activator NlpD